MNRIGTYRNRSPRVSLTPEILKTLRDHVTRTGKGVYALLRDADDAPADLDPNLINSWFGGKVVTVRKDHLDYILKLYETPALDILVPITDDMRTEFMNHVRRTGLKSKTLIRATGYNDKGRMECWLHGRTKRAPKNELHAFIERCRALPDAPLKTLKQTIKKRPYQSASPSRHPPLMPEMSEALRTEIERTGIGPTALAEKYLNDMEDISASLINRWVTGAIKTARRDLYERALETWRGLPDDPYIFYTPEIGAAMKAEQHRTNVGVCRILSKSDDVPEGLTAEKIQHFCDGRQKKLRRLYFDYIMKKWSEFPDAESEVIPLTPEIIDILRQQAARTGKGPQAILAGARDRPEGLNASSAAGWLKGLSKTVRKVHLEYILKRYEMFESNNSEKVPITEDIRLEMRRQIERTGIGPTALLRRAKDKPKGLNAHRIGYWIAGISKTARKDQLDYILNRWKNDPQFFRQASGRIKLTSEIIEKIEDYWRRTGISIQRLVEFSSDAPPDLNARLVRAWLYREITSARKDHVDYVLKVLESLPYQRGRVTYMHAIAFADETKNPEKSV